MLLIIIFLTTTVTTPNDNLLVATTATTPNGHACLPGHNSSALPFCDHTLPVATRVKDLLRRLSVEEKAHLIAIRGDAPDAGVTRLGIPPYSWGIEILHGAGINCVGAHCPTIFPVLACAASSFNRSAWHGVGAAISTEMRAANNNGAVTRPGSTEPVGLNGWGPNINLARDPRWGRELEVPSEDPTLAGKLAASMTRGLQEGEDPKYVKLLGALKHFTAYSMEHSNGKDRGGFSPTISKHDMSDSYLPAFRIGIEEGGALGIMCSYTTVNGTAMCESAEWQQQWAREKIGFQGNIVTDCTALNMKAPSPEANMSAAQNAALGVKAGTDLNCGNGWDGKEHGYTAIPAAISQGLTSEAELDVIAGRSLALRMRTGLFDPLQDQMYTKLPLALLGAPAHHDLAEDVASQGLVLLQNPLHPRNLNPRTPNGAARVLPLRTGKKTAVIGPHASADRQLLGSYFSVACPLPAKCPKKTKHCPHGSAKAMCPGLDFEWCALDWSCVTSPLAAIAAVSGGATTTAPGCSDGVPCSPSQQQQSFADAVAVAQAADQLVIVLGISSDIEREGYDRTNTTLPGAQEELALRLLALCKPTVVILLNGGILSVDKLLAAALPSNPPAIVEAWYPGIRGGPAIAKALFGVTNRWGKLPVTVYDSTFSDSVNMTDMSMTAGLGRTYKYWSGPQPLFEFGHGLSLTSFALAWTAPAPPKSVTVQSAAAALTLSVSLENTGGRDGDEVVMLYHVPSASVQRPPQEALLPLPHRKLLDFRRVALARSASATTVFSLNASSLGLVDTEGNTYLYPGTHELRVDRGPTTADALRLTVHVDAAEPILVDTLL